MIDTIAIGQALLNLIAQKFMTIDSDFQRKVVSHIATYV